ncbi:hypothetical protein RF819_02765 [Rhodoferax fermentans]|uniref:Uncharacterized protein n=2 Tax=Rhodoferax fermentans TaxID=28066 RepID=A0A1T1ANR0_RHOFE|nr:hypothetical protein RF819_02765 [Rhodoferax fermentans]
MIAQADQTIEQEIQAKGLTAPRVTPEGIEANIASEHYFTAMEGVIGGEMAEGQTIGEVKDYEALSLLTFCVLILRNSTKIVGINYGAIDPAQHSAETGRVEARKHAIEQIWPLMGCELRQRLHSNEI